jgi:hypothetical protein
MGRTYGARYLEKTCFKTLRRSEKISYSKPSGFKGNPKG